MAPDRLDGRLALSMIIFIFFASSVGKSYHGRKYDVCPILSLFSIHKMILRRIQFNIRNLFEKIVWRNVPLVWDDHQWMIIWKHLRTSTSPKQSMLPCWMFYDLPIPKKYLFVYFFFFFLFWLYIIFCYTTITPNSKKHIMIVQPSISDKNTMLSDFPTSAEYLKFIRICNKIGRTKI